MKNLDKNKTYKILGIAIIFIVVIIVIICIALGGKNKIINETNLSLAAQKYFKNNSTILPQNNYDSNTVSLATLISAGYINGESEGATCPSYVVVTKMNNDYTYTPFIKCNLSTTPTLLSKVMASITTSGEGLYNYNGKYIFRGKDPNNYVKFGDTLWRIIGLDKNTNIKMIYSKGAVLYNFWDSKYNSTTDRQSGINDYINEEGKSNVKAYLEEYFKEYPELFTGERIARMVKYDVCIGKANLASNSLNTCSKLLQNQLISIITAEDYLDASLDQTCTATNTKTCQNYNFLNQNGWTITANSQNSYEVYYTDNDEGLKLQSAYIQKAVRPVIALKNDVTYISGTGTAIDPYVIK